MRFLTADYLYPLHIGPLEEGVLQISDEGEVVAIFKNRDSFLQEKLEVFKGILCPGFVNAHCHLELSHLKGFIRQSAGLLSFILAMQKRNDFSQKEIAIAIDYAEKQMIENGIVAVGDICNTSHTICQKKKRNLQYYNFIEVFGVKDEAVSQIINDAKNLRDKFRNIGFKSTISPHSAYSVPKNLMHRVADVFDEEDTLISIHMQEALLENSLFENKEGLFLNWLKSVNASSEIWQKRDTSVDVLIELGHKRKLLVHNTFSKKDQIGSNYYCTCPKSNLYIENALPDYSIFDPNKLCVGTDSLASNNSFSILDELQIIKENSDFDLNTLLKIASRNGAEALGFDNLGSFEEGKKPGVNLISQLSSVEVIA